MEKSQKTDDMFKLTSLWMDTAKSFWTDMAREQARMQGKDTSSKQASEADREKYKTYRTWETSVNNFTSLMKLMSSAENQEALAKGLGVIFEGAVQATGDSLENVADFQKQIMESFSKIGKHTKAYNLDDFDHSVFQSFRDLYQSELQKYLFIPKIGLPREFQEQFSNFLDKLNIFYSHLLELMYIFSLPFEKTNVVIQEKAKEMLEKGEFIDDPKQAYSEWIKTLEKHFMELMVSPDYLRVLNNTISSLADYKVARNEVMNVFLKEQQIPTNKEMDAVYKDMYEMKKEIKKLTREVKTLKKELTEKEAQQV